MCVSCTAIFFSEMPNAKGACYNTYKSGLTINNKQERSELLIIPFSIVNKTCTLLWCSYAGVSHITVIQMSVIKHDSEFSQSGIPFTYSNAYCYIQIYHYILICRRLHNMRITFAFVCRQLASNKQHNDTELRYASRKTPGVPWIAVSEKKV